jgi:cell wall-associated NlpC family hydrolase
MKRIAVRFAALGVMAALVVTGCDTYGDKNSDLKNGASALADKAYAPNTTSQAAHVVESSYNARTKIVMIKVALYGEPGRRLAHMTAPTQNHFGENVVDLARTSGLVDYAAAQYPNQTIQTVKVSRIDRRGVVSPEMLVHVPIDLQTPVSLKASGTTGDMATAASHVADRGIQLPPPGCEFDHNIEPTATASQPRAMKTRAVLSVAQSKIGVPYVWGHNEDRGQIGFDCSNFTAFVYHHALGYHMTTSSRGQNRSVGVPVEALDKQPGDLLIFENGKHVGIYSGNNRAIQEGGGLGKVGYLSVAPNTYWGKHITSVRRMY